MKTQERKTKGTDFHALLCPEHEIEFVMLEDPGFVNGLDWGLPRYGHPEGKIYLHMQEVLQNIDKLGAEGEERFFLRAIAFLHDTFKFRERKGVGAKRVDQHGFLARSYAASNFPVLEPVFDLIEWHDEAYFVWRKIFLKGQRDEGLRRLERLQARLGDRSGLFYDFFWCDTRTGDKNPAPLIWYEKQLGIAPVGVRDRIKAE